MPSFYPSTLPRQLPLTPPDYAPFPDTAVSYHSEAAAAAAYGQEARYAAEGFEPFGFTKPSHLTNAPTTHAMYPHAHPAPSYHTSHLRAPRDAAGGFGPISAPTLPPIRIPDNSDLNRMYQNLAAVRCPAPVHEPPKEEKVAGGVAAHLDYEIEQMVDFVAEMAQGMYDIYLSKFCLADIDMSRSVQPSSSVSQSFRKYVSQILTSTRLPSSTLLLALHYLATRMTMLSSNGVFTSSTGHLYHMLTTALMLASKFLDDNTFQNRSWAEVSHIPVADLNKHEMDWLVDINWNLHIDSNDPQGLSAWIKQWERYQARRVEMSMGALKLTPVDTSLRVQYSGQKYNMPLTPVYTPTSYGESVYGMPSKSNTSPQWSQWAPSRTLSPPSASHSGPNTPDWFNSKRDALSYGQNNTGPWSSFGQLPPLRSSAGSPYYTPYSTQPYNTSMWGHGTGCSCGYCPLSHDRYGMCSSYGIQPVAG